MDRKENLVYWEKGQSGNPKGRPKSLLGAINNELKNEGIKPVTLCEIKEGFLLSLALPTKKMQEIYENNDAPMFLKITIRELMNKKKGAQFMLAMMERCFGRVGLESVGETVETPSVEIHVLADTGGGIRFQQKTEQIETKEDEKND